MVIRFHLDENMPHVVADGLKLRGRDVTTSSETGLLGASDLEQFVFARRNSRVLVTQDDDLLSLAAGDEPHSGVVFWSGKRAVGQVIKALDALCYEVSAEDMVGRVRFL